MNTSLSLAYHARLLRLSAGLLALLAGLLITDRTRAQSEDIDSQRFLPAATTGGYIQTEGSDVRYPVDPFALGLWLSYGHNPLLRVVDDEVASRIVAHQVALDVTASYALTTWFELGLHAPLAYLAGDGLSEAALGDVRLLPKFRLLSDLRDGVGLALLADTRLPTHTSRFYGGARMPAFAPRLVLDHRFGLSGFRAAINAGVLIRKATDFRNVHAGTELLASVGLGYRFANGRAPVELLLDVHSATGLTETDREEVALEGLLSLGADLSRDWKLLAGGGMGLLRGFGVPTGRALVGLRWAPSPNDPDHDGIRSDHPAPEPEPSESALTARDEPPAARDEPVAAHDEGDAQGGEDPGASVDAVDDAAREAAIRGGYDACPDLPEDYDGIDDEDGCPEGDADHDGVLDYLDRCPDEAETINGFEDDDGCQDEGPAQIVIEEGRITILETIRFEPNSSKLARSSYPIMNQIALTLRKHRDLNIAIGGHTDSTGPRALNARLSRDRARSVRQYLLERGIPPARLSARGFGPDQPIADNDSDEGRARNRRVEFLVR